MNKRTILEEINRIRQINEYGYDYDDVSSNRPHRGPQISYTGSIGYGKKKEKLSPEERSAINKAARQSHPLDINNQKDKMVIFAHLLKGHNIKNATPETLEIIKPLIFEKYVNRIGLSNENELELEFGYYLLRFNMYGVERRGYAFTGFHLSPTFTSILNDEESGFKRKVIPSYEEFKNFMVTNKDVFDNEILDFFKKKK